MIKILLGDGLCFFVVGYVCLLRAASLFVVSPDRSLIGNIVVIVLALSVTDTSISLLANLVLSSLATV